MRIPKFMRFFIGLFAPLPYHDYYSARLSMKAELSWQPYLHTTVWWGIVATMMVGDPMFYPPGDGLDWIWLLGGLTFPIVGLTAVWLLKHGSGTQRYAAFWLRLASDIGLASVLMAYEVERLCVAPFTPPCVGCGVMWQPFVDPIITGCIVFLGVLIYRDIRFLRITESVADKLISGELSMKPGGRATESGESA